MSPSVLSSDSHGNQSLAASSWLQQKAVSQAQPSSLQALLSDTAAEPPAQEPLISEAKGSSPMDLIDFWNQLTMESQKAVHDQGVELACRSKGGVY